MVRDNRWYLEKNNTPRQKDMTATSDLTHMFLGKSEGKWLTPSPIKMVFPPNPLESCCNHQMLPHTSLHSDETAIGVESKTVNNSGNKETSNEN